MDDATLVRVFEAIRDLLRNRQGFVERDRPMRDALGEGWSFNQLHYQRVFPVRLLQAVNGGNVGMVQRGQDLCFTPEARHALGVSSEYVREHLQGHITAQLAVPGPIHFSHSARTKWCDDLIGTDFRAGGGGHQCVRLYNGRGAADGWRETLELLNRDA
jgi:hypothetical protein